MDTGIKPGSACEVTRNPPMQAGFGSAPTVGGMLKTAMALFANYEEFDILGKKSQVIALTSDCIVLNEGGWKGGIIMDPKKGLVEELATPPKLLESFSVEQIGEENIRTSTRKLKPEDRGPLGLLLMRPLYGSRDAPLRWRIRLSKVLRRGVYRQLRCDPCVYTKHSESTQNQWNMFGMDRKVLTSIIIAHVDDLMHFGTKEALVEFASLMKEFKHGDIATLTEKEGSTYCGVEIKLRHGREVQLSQDTYAQTIQPMGKTDFIQEGKIKKSPDQIRTGGKTIHWCNFMGAASEI